MVREDGEPQVMDFGLARDLRSEARLSVAGEVFGTPSYMAPEQARGSHDQCDARTDVYALGGVLYDALTGIPPHPGKDIAQVFRHVLEGEVVPPRRLCPDLPIDIETVCLKCLEADRAARYASAEALADDLARFLRGEPVSARPLGWMGRQARRVRRRPLLSALVGAFAIALVGLSWRLAGPARVHVVTDPKGARVEAVGRAMWSGGWVWPAGRFTLRITAEGHEPREVPVDLSAGSFHDLGTVGLRPTPATLTLASWPPEVEVTLTREGATPLRLPTPFDRLPIDAGTYELTATREGYFPLERRIEAAPGASVASHVTLQRERLWARDLQDIIHRPPALADLDRDGALDVVVCAQTQSTVWVLSGRDGSVLWRRRVGESLQCTPWIEDRNHDGVPDVRVVSFDGNAFALDGRDGTPLAEAGDGPDNGPPPPETVDIDGDGFLDRVSVEAQSIVVSSVGGVGLASVTRSAGPTEAGPSVVDLDGDGALDHVKLSGFGYVQATSGRTRAPLWGWLAMDGVAPGDVSKDLKGVAADPVAGDLDGDGTAECVVAMDDGQVHALSGTHGVRKWTWRIEGEPRGPLAMRPAQGRDGSDVVVAREDGRVFVLTPPLATAEDSFQRMLAQRVLGVNEEALARVADEVAKSDRDPWRRSVGWGLLGIVRGSQGKHEEALSCLSEARSLGLRCPESAATEWTAAWAWKGCPAARREEAGRLLEEGLRVDPDRVLDAVLEARGAIGAEAARDLAVRVRGALDHDGPRVVAVLLATLLLPNDTRPPEPVDVERRLREAIHAVHGRLVEAPVRDPRLLGYLCLLYDALGDEDRYREVFDLYMVQPRRPPALDRLLLLHVNARYGVK